MFNFKTHLAGAETTPGSLEEGRPRSDRGIAVGRDGKWGQHFRNKIDPNAKSSPINTSVVVNR
jgi:hypothetical protein